MQRIESTEKVNEKGTRRRKKSLSYSFSDETYLRTELAASKR